MKNNKRAVSGVVAAVILIVLVLAATALVWAVVKNLVDEELSGAESCFGNFGEIEINSAYTCYNPSENELQVSVSVGDIKLDALIVSITGEAKTKSFEIRNQTTIDYVKNYGDTSFGIALEIPEENSGLTYVVNMVDLGFSQTPLSVKIAPVISGEECEVSDSLFQIDDCSLLA